MSMGASNLPPGVTGGEDHFQDETEICCFHDVCELKRTCQHAKPHVCDGQRPRGYCPGCVTVSEDKL